MTGTSGTPVHFEVSGEPADAQGPGMDVLEMWQEVVGLKSVGHIVELWRYPVSSLGGERLDALDLTETGVAGTRIYTVFDTETREPASPETSEKWRKALQLRARTRDDDRVEVGFPDEVWLAVDAPELVARLSGHLGFSAALGEHTGTGGVFPVIPPRYTASPLHLITTASMAELRTRNETLTIDTRRFRPDVVVNTTATGFVENDWVGSTIDIGDTSLLGTEGTKRCGMTMIAQPGLPEEPEILRNILRHNRRNLGIYADITRAGRVAVGDPVLVGG